ncbi:MAG: hypothetical protein IT378_02750 [Sandaracinaceae bacterium]|nr:hypothetical protein [Sandaracinaceae bacterium]
MLKTVPVPMIALLLFMCGEDEQAEPEIPAAAGTETVAVAAPSALAPEHGGTVLMAGQYPLEVVAQNDGNVRAFVRAAEAPAPERVRLTVRAPDASGNQHPIVLRWDDSQGAYVGRARRVQLAPGPLSATMIVDGTSYQASVPTFVLVPAAPAVVVERPAAPQVVQPGRPTVVVERPAGPTVVVERPAGPTVVVERPAPPTIVVERPAPPTIVVQRPAPPTIVVQRPAPPAVIVQPPSRPTVIVTPPARPGVVVVQPGRGRGKFKQRGRGHGRGH